MDYILTPDRGLPMEDIEDLHERSYNNTFGGLDNEMIMAKAEETYMDDDPDEDITKYSRTVAADWRPDAPTFEHERPRGGTGWSGRLSMQYGGHRGEADPPYRPEIFDGFGGPDDADPRGVATEPDMKQLRAQEQARMRFVRFAAEGSDSITGGGQSESGIAKVKQRLFKMTRDRLKIFSSQMDGRPSSRAPKQCRASTVPKQIHNKSYGDMLPAEGGLVHRTRVIAGQIIRDSREFRAETLDQSVAVARYGQARRRATKTTYYDLPNAREGTQLAADSDGTMQFRAAGLLMANIVRGRTQMADAMRGSDMDFAHSHAAAARKTAPMARDLALIMQGVAVDAAQFGTADPSIVWRGSAPVRGEHAARTTAQQHYATYLNAEVIYKSVAQGQDLTKIGRLIHTDVNAPEVTAVAAQQSRSVGPGWDGRRMNIATDAAATESHRTFNYRAGQPMLWSNNMSAQDARFASGDNTQSRKVNHRNYRITSPNDTVEQMKFGDNRVKERHIGVVGNKYMFGFIDRDGRPDDIAGLA